MAASPRHPARAVCVRKRDQDIVISDLSRRVYGLTDAANFLPIENAMVKRNNDLRLTRRGGGRFNPQQRGYERTMNSSRPIMHRRTPHAMVDADRWGDVATSNGGSAAGLRCIDNRFTLHIHLRRVCLVDLTTPNKQRRSP